MFKKTLQAAIVPLLLLVLTSCFTTSNLMLVDVSEKNVDQYAQIRVIENHQISIITVDGKELEKNVYKVGVTPGKHEITVLLEGGSFHAQMQFSKTRRSFLNETRTIEFDVKAGRSSFIQYLSITHLHPETLLESANLLLWVDSNNYESRLGEPRRVKYTEDKKTITGNYSVDRDQLSVMKYLLNELLLQQSKGEMVSKLLISPEILYMKGNSSMYSIQITGLRPRKEHKIFHSIPGFERLTINLSSQYTSTRLSQAKYQYWKQHQGNPQYR